MRVRATDHAHFRIVTRENEEFLDIQLISGNLLLNLSFNYQFRLFLFNLLGVTDGWPVLLEVWGRVIFLYDHYAD